MKQFTPWKMTMNLLRLQNYLKKKMNKSKNLQTLFLRNCRDIQKSFTNKWTKYFRASRNLWSNINLIKTHKSCLKAFSLIWINSLQLTRKFVRNRNWFLKQTMWISCLKISLLILRTLSLAYSAMCTLKSINSTRFKPNFKKRLCTTKLWWSN